MRSPVLKWLALVALCASVGCASWPGFEDVSESRETHRYSFGGTNPEAGTTNENYYDGDMGDIDGDGLPDRILGSRYGLLHNQGDAWMEVARKQLGFLLRGDPGAHGWGEDASQFADVDGDDDLDALMGGNHEPLTLQINEEGRFRIGWSRTRSGPRPSTSSTRTSSETATSTW